ncbi:MAG: ATP-binding cassette domain-containing protein [Desulfurococcaceae archaeon]
MALIAGIKRAGYDERSILLKNIDLKVNEGQIIVIAGPSGSGKTTLIFSLTGVLKHVLNGVIEGSINIDELNPLILEDFERLPGKIGILMQDPERQLIFPTPVDEISASLEALGLPYEDAMVQALNLLNNIGLKSKENTHVEDLSSGERRRLTIALAQIGDPSTYLFDEPSANLDPQGIMLVRELVAKLKKMGKTILIVEHKIQYFSDIADEIFLLHKGGLSKAFTVEDLFVKLPECRNEVNPRGKTIVEFEGSIGYRDKTVLRNVEFNARRGEIIAVVGPNGSGKTTLLKTIAGYLKPLEGKVSLYTRKFFYAPQNPDLVFVHRTTRKELESIARKTGVTLDELLSKYPMFTKLKDLSPFQLSHGQRRLLELLIAFSYGEDLVMLDEPTTGLDPYLYEHVIKELKLRALNGSTVIIATHDPRVVVESTRVYLIESDRLREADKCQVAESMFKTMGVIYE